MNENWDSPTENIQNGGEYKLDSVDTGRNFSRGRGFVKQISSGPANDDKGWGSENHDSWGSTTRGNRKVGNSDSFDNNGNEDTWGISDNAGSFERRGRGGGRGGRGGRGNRGNRSNNFRNDNDDWGAGDEDGERRGYGGGRGGRRGRGGRGGGFKNDANDWGSSGDAGSYENRGRSSSHNNDGDDWGNGDSSGGIFKGRGRDRGRGRGDDNPGSDKPREIYIPPEPTEDAKEMFGTSITSGINFDKYDNIPVEVTGDNIVLPIKDFQQSGLRQILLDNITKSGYDKPTPIQKTAIPSIMAGRDVMACAQTGSGKTAAYLLPIIHNLLEAKAELIVGGNHCEPQVVIVSPTRELAIQIWSEARKFAYDSMIRTVVTYGGVSVKHQISQIMSGCHILVATPGRMNDFVNREVISFQSVRYVILDEADRMLDMGFLPAIEQMMSHQSMSSENRQTLMFSATFPEEIQHLAARFLRDYLFITVGIVGGACSDVQQIFHQVDKFSKRQKLLDLLTEEGSERTLVFVETKRNADFIAVYLNENNLRTTSIHGDRLQSEREEALRDFKSGNRDILVATDVAARGLDIKNVMHVINYDLPKSIDEYVHRIGRTGRVGNRGKASSFFDTTQNGNLAPDLLRILKQANQSIPDWLESASQGGGSYYSGNFGARDVRGNDYTLAKDFDTAEEQDNNW